MSQEYFIQSNHDTIQVPKDIYQVNNRLKYQNGDELEKKQLTMDYLSGIRADSRATVSEEKAIVKLDSKSKKAYGAVLRNAEKERAEKIDKYTDKALSGFNLDKSCVKHIAAFFTGKKEIDRALINGYTDMEHKSEGVLKYCIREFMKLSIENLNISSPKKLAGKASLLEKLSVKHEAIVRLIVEHRDDYDKLPEDLRDQFENKLGQANGLVNYYRLMKSLMTDRYYITHDVSKLSTKNPMKDTPDEKRVRSLLLNVRGGADAIKATGTDIMNKYLDKMSGTLSANIVDNKSLNLSKDLLAHKEKLENLTISQYIDQLESKGEVDGFDKTEKEGVFERGKKIARLKLPESVEESYGKIGAILTQLDFVNALTYQKNDHQGFYNLEQNFRDIGLLDEVCKLGTPLKKLKEIILAHGGISEDGSLKIVKLSVKDRKDLQKEYKEALTSYRAIFESINDYNAGLYMAPPEDDEMDMAFKNFYDDSKMSAIEKAKKHHPDDAEQKQLREELRTLTATLAEGEYSDFVIYTNAPKILDLSVKCQSFLAPKEKERLNSLVYLASELRINKRTKDLNEAMRCDAATDELKGEHAEEIKALETYAKVVDISEEKTKRNKELQLILRNQAQRMKFDTADIRAEASNYLFHDEWLKNTYRKKEKFSFGSIFDYVRNKTILGITRFASWLYSKKRTNHHGAELYDVSKRDLVRLPQELHNFGEANADQSITFGDGTYAPKVELNKYFKDPMKMQLYKDYCQIANLMPAGKEYPQSMKDAAEALSCYCQVRGMVNRDTYEMEQAFLEKFNLSVDKMIQEEHGDYPLLKRKIHEAYKHYAEMSCGTLGNHLKLGELKAIEEQKAVYTKKTYFGDSEESNMRNLPLFPHSPNLNDVKQGVLGNCYLVGAVQTILSTDPEAIRDMFHDLGDGNVIVRLYAAYGEVEKDGKKVYTRIDDSATMVNATMRPVYVKVKKHYETGEEGSCDCMWMQLLEKAYAAAGFNQGKPDIDENGVLKNLDEELTAGEPHAALMHMTGKYYVGKTQSDVTNGGCVFKEAIRRKKALSDYQSRVILGSIPAYLHDQIYTLLITLAKNQKNYIEDPESEDKFIRSVVDDVLKGNSLIYSDSELDVKLAELVEKGKIKEDQKELLISKLKDLTDCSDYMVETYTNVIRRNLNTNTILTDTSPITGTKDIPSMIPDLIMECAKEDVTFDKLWEIVNGEVKYYELEKDDKQITDLEKRLMKTNIKSLLVPNKEQRYSADELAYLKVMINEIREKRTVPVVYNAGHILTVLDVKLHDGKWFLLVRDPFNIEHAEYTKNGNGEVEKKLPGLSDVYHNHTAIRELSSDMKNGFMGTSWWELSDAFEKFDDFVLPKEKARQYGIA